MDQKQTPFTPFVVDGQGNKFVVAESIGCNFWKASYDGLGTTTFDGDDTLYLRLEDAIRWAEGELRGRQDDLLALALPKLKAFAADAIAADLTSVTSARSASPTAGGADVRTSRLIRGNDMSNDLNEYDTLWRIHAEGSWGDAPSTVVLYALTDDPSELPDVKAAFAALAPGEEDGLYMVNEVRKVDRPGADIDGVQCCHEVHDQRRQRRIPLVDLG